MNGNALLPKTKMNSTMKRFLFLLVLAAGLFGCGRTPEPRSGFRAELTNPIIPGFHPDPSVAAVGEDYYIVNSSFHYFPGVPVYHSRDLVNWELLGNVLDRPAQLSLAGANSWGGIYAPTIRYHDGTFYMITTNVGSGGNFMVTATDPAGPWSDPIWLEQQGIDPSLYFENGRCYMVSNPDGVITLCEIDPVYGATLSPSKPLWKGTGGRYPEGPHIYRKDGWYYLLISEGGTELAHKLTIARSRRIEGPYDPCPDNPILTHCSAKGQNSRIQGTGHGDFFQSEDGAWWCVFLAYRRAGGDFHHLGRETFLAPVEWIDGWPVINGGEPVAEKMDIGLPKAPEAPSPKGISLDLTSFRQGHPCPSETLGPQWVHIHEPIPEHYLFSEKGLTLTGTGEGLDPGSYQPTGLFCRQESFDAKAETQVRLESDGEAGLSVYQADCGHADFFLRRIGGKTEAVVRYRIRSLVHEEAAVPIRPSGETTLRIRAEGDRYLFDLLENDSFRTLATLESSLLSSEVVGGFTGVTIGMFCASGTASFSSFRLSEQ